MMKEHLNKQTNTEKFFYVYQNYAFDKWPYEGDIFSENGNLKLVLAASLFNHVRILKWLKEEKNMDLNDNNQRGESSLHLGILFNGLLLFLI